MPEQSQTFVDSLPGSTTFDTRSPVEVSKGSVLRAIPERYVPWRVREAYMRDWRERMRGALSVSPMRRGA
jgi:hypothetical protein